jgi:putative intracellular protease/amidase
LKVLILLPASDYDPTESAVPWYSLSNNDYQITFSTPNGEVAHADERLVSKGFSCLSPLFMTRKVDLKKYHLMLASMRYSQVIAYKDIEPSNYDALFIPGGHAQGVKSLLESKDASKICRHFMSHNKPVGAICHGVLLLARSKSEDGQSLLQGRTTTALTNMLEIPAWLLTFPWLGRYYRTYKMTVENEVKAALSYKGKFLRGKPFPVRDNESNTSQGFVVLDDNYLSARWPGDCNLFAKEFVSLLNSYKSDTSSNKANKIV